MMDRDIVRDRRFREAIRSNEASRAVYIFLRIKFPGIENLDSLPRDERQNALDCVVSAMMEKHQVEKELEMEMR